MSPRPWTRPGQHRSAYLVLPPIQSQGRPDRQESISSGSKTPSTLVESHKSEGSNDSQADRQDESAISDRSTLPWSATWQWPQDLSTGSAAFRHTAQPAGGREQENTAQSRPISEVSGNDMPIQGRPEQDEGNVQQRGGVDPRSFLPQPRVPQSHRIPQSVTRPTESANWQRTERVASTPRMATVQAGQLVSHKLYTCPTFYFESHGGRIVIQYWADFRAPSEMVEAIRIMLESDDDTSCSNRRTLHCRDPKWRHVDIYEPDEKTRNWFSLPPILATVRTPCQMRTILGRHRKFIRLTEIRMENTRIDMELNDSPVAGNRFQEQRDYNQVQEDKITRSWLQEVLKAWFSVDVFIRNTNDEINLFIRRAEARGVVVTPEMKAVIDDCRRRGDDDTVFKLLRQEGLGVVSANELAGVFAGMRA
ncbi:hypothetical protein BDZ85DRAFT_15376 [Elsinoe ampelina]|uniref:Uncharacterized protein n=1 Tax=Elsinoe ampelina TaxID=302913 RepID=A0A6A6G6L1_9PEZI|nr:hypothetical protein BDZ85DRAFT_15376 [Elsinoe ampelina]